MSELASEWGGSGENGMWVEIFKMHLESGCEVKTGVDGSGLSLSERGVCFIDVVGVGAGRSQSWVQLPVNVIRRGGNVRSRAPATD